MPQATTVQIHTSELSTSAQIVRGKLATALATARRSEESAAELLTEAIEEMQAMVEQLERV